MRQCITRQIHFTWQEKKTQLISEIIILVHYCILKENYDMEDNWRIGEHNNDWVENLDIIKQKAQQFILNGRRWQEIGWVRRKKNPWLWREMHWIFKKLKLPTIFLFFLSLFYTASIRSWRNQTKSHVKNHWPSEQWIYIELKSICWKLDAYAEADEKQIVYMAN